MRGVRIPVLVVSGISGAITVAAALPPELDRASRAPTLRAALGTAPPLIALAAFVPRRRLRRPGLALSASGAAVAATLLLIATVAPAFAARLPKVPVGATAQGLLVGFDLHADAVLPALEVTVAAIYGLAAVGFRRGSELFHDEFFGWLAIAAVLAAAAHVNYFLHPSLYAQFASVGDLFLLCWYTVLLAVSVSLRLQRQGSHVRLRVSDNGTGFDPAVPADGFGLTSMRDRASSVGGDLGISSEPGRGTEVEAAL